MGARLATAGAVLLVAYDGGAYGGDSRAVVGVTVWWAVLVGLALGIFSLERLPLCAVATAALLCGLAGWTALSALWTDGGQTFVEFDRVLVYVGVFTLALTLRSGKLLLPLADGLALGLTLVAAIALVSRLFPFVFLDDGLPSAIRPTTGRLSFPVGYWNGLAVLVAFALPLVLRIAVLASTRVGRATAMSVLPLLAATMYLSGSRGGAASAAVGVTTYVALTPRVRATLRALAIGAVGAAAGIASVATQPSVLSGLVSRSGEVAGGPIAAVLLVAVCAATGLGSTAFWNLSARSRRRRPAFRAATVLATIVVLAVVGVVLGHAQRPPRSGGRDASASTGGHLVSVGGGGRRQFWTAAVDAFRSRPITGRGAGSFAAWWAEHPRLPFLIRDAHSLFLETLAELGLVGFALVLGAFSIGLAGAAGQTLRAPPDARPALAALTAIFLVYVVAASVDWMWELTVVTVVGVFSLGLATASEAFACSPARRRISLPRGPGVVLAAAACVAELAPLVHNV